jgi:Golgi phosphoprotein 3 GPP34
MDLLLLAIAPSGRTWFGPKLSYTLPVAELIEFAQSDRVGLQDGNLIVQDNLAQHEGSTVYDYVRGRGPHRIDPYLADASSQGIVRIVTVAPERKKLEVTDAEPIKAMARRLVAVLDDPVPGFKDISFAVLADAAGIARPHLRGWAHRKHRACLPALRDATGDGAPAEILRAGLAAISQLSPRASQLASTDPGTFDERIGLTPEARRAAMWFGL